MWKLVFSRLRFSRFRPLTVMITDVQEYLINDSSIERKMATLASMYKDAVREYRKSKVIKEKSALQMAYARRAMAKGKIIACAACRVQRKKCSEDCILAPHFPADDLDNFTVVQRVYGTSHVIKLLQGLDAEQRAEAVSSLVSEASARVKDPIKGSTGLIHELQKKIKELESQLEDKREEIMNMRSEYDKLLFLPFSGSPDAQNMDFTDLTEEILWEDIDLLQLWQSMDV